MEYRILKGQEKIGKEDVKMAKVVEMKEETKSKEDKLKSTMDKIGKGVKVFGDGFVKQVTDADTLASSVGVGLVQGFKYNGSVERGIKSGLGCLASLGTLGGVIQVVKNWTEITKD